MSNTKIPLRGSPTDQLIAVMARLRDPQGGCPWDLEQNFSTIAPFTIEEAYEVAEAIACEDWVGLEGELGDLLLQVVYHARLAEEAGLFDFADVARAITAKMIRRHPHVFGAATVADAQAQAAEWEETKARERAARSDGTAGRPSVLDDVPAALPALTRALKLQRRAARVGFDWPDLEGVRAKLREELGELDEALGDPKAAAAQAEELGDLLFSVVNLARHLAIDPEEALRAANRKFERRFRRVEELLELGDASRPPLPLARLDAAWDRAKAEVKG